MTIQELEKIIVISKQKLKLLKEKYSNLEASLVFSSHSGQVELTSDPLKILREFPKMYEFSTVKERAIFLMGEISLLDKAIKDVEDKSKTEMQKKIFEKEKELRSILPDLVFDAGTQIELRFNNLNYELIQMLRSDPLIDRDLTLQSAASIRIVLGTLRTILKKERD